MARATQGLKIAHIKRSTTFVDGDDMVDHLGWGEDALSLAFLAERTLTQLQRAEAPPPTALVEAGVVVAVALESFPLREPWSPGVFLYGRHGSTV